MRSTEMEKWKSMTEKKRVNYKMISSSEKYRCTFMHKKGGICTKIVQW